MLRHLKVDLLRSFGVNDSHQARSDSARLCWVGGARLSRLGLSSGASDIGVVASAAVWFCAGVRYHGVSETTAKTVATVRA
jgi:hypothetical protein